MNDILHRIDIFSELGRRLRNFGHDEASQFCINQAIAENEWFSAKDIELAVEAICREFLDKERLECWLNSYATVLAKCSTKRVAIIMAGNIPLVGFFDMMCVLICGHSVAIKPSSKDNVLMEYICNILRDIEPNIAITHYDPAAEYDKIIATGSNSTARLFSQRYTTTPSLIRGSRHSAALLDGNESAEELDGLSRDIFSYNGMGCRSISLLWLPQNYTPHIAAPKVSDMYHGNYLHNRAMLTMQGVELSDLGGALTVEQEGFSDTLSIINIMRYTTIDQAEEWLMQHDDSLQCVVSHCSHHPRCVAFGQAQYPTLSDYADGVDVIAFLTE